MERLKTKQSKIWSGVDLPFNRDRNFDFSFRLVQIRTDSRPIECSAVLRGESNIFLSGKPRRCFCLGLRRIPLGDSTNSAPESQQCIAISLSFLPFPISVYAIRIAL